VLDFAHGLPVAVQQHIELCQVQGRFRAGRERLFHEGHLALDQDQGAFGTCRKQGQQLFVHPGALGHVLTQQSRIGAPQHGFGKSAAQVNLHIGQQPAHHLAVIARLVEFGCRLEVLGAQFVHRALWWVIELFFSRILWASSWLARVWAANFSR
jgi:hypothetical protein